MNVNYQDRSFPSSQICSECGHMEGKKPLKTREWTCPIYHSPHDREINSSILIEGLQTRTVGTTGIAYKRNRYE